MTLLFDTDFLYARYNNRDERHKDTNIVYKKIMLGEYGNPVLLDYVFDELVTLIQVRSSGKIAREVGQELLSLIDSKLITLLQVNSSDFFAAWELFSKQSDAPTDLENIKKWQSSKKDSKLLSFTDCVIIEVAKSLQIPVIAGFDQRFKSWVKLIPNESNYSTNL